MRTEPLLTTTDAGFYCPIGDFHIDPWKPVPRAVVTHAHADHYAWGCDHYLVAEEGKHVFRTRLGADAQIQTQPYGEGLIHNGVRISFHPAGHILGSAQIRVEHEGEVWVITGDYKTERDSTCRPSSLCVATALLQKRPLACPFMPGGRSSKFLPRSTGGGGKMPRQGAPACSTATPSAKRNGYSLALTRQLARFSPMEPPNGSTEPIARVG
ncbi:MAG: hypothetical protein R2932_44095 [Caldilineaceae bacterium]